MNCVPSLNKPELQDEKRASKLWEKLGGDPLPRPSLRVREFHSSWLTGSQDLERIMERLKRSAVMASWPDPTLSLKVTLDHFYGIEIDRVATELPRSAMLVNRQCDLEAKAAVPGRPTQRLPIETLGEDRGASSS